MKTLIYLFTLILFAISLFAQTYTEPERIKYIAFEDIDKAVNVEGVVVIELWASWNDDNAYDIDRLYGCTAYRIDVDENPRAIEAYGVYSLPTVLFFLNGEFQYKDESDITYQAKEDLQHLQDHINELNQ